MRAVRHALNLSLHGPRTEAMAALAKRGADTRRPDRGSVPFPFEASNPEVVGTLRAFMRQDPNLVFADEVRTDEELQMLINASLTGHRTAGVLEAQTPEAALQRVRAAVPDIPVAPLIVHHTVDAQSGARKMALYRVVGDGTGPDRVERWRSD